MQIQFLIWQKGRDVQTKLDKLNEESLKLKEGALVFSGKSAGDITKAIKEERINRIERISTLGKENIIAP